MLLCKCKNGGGFISTVSGEEGEEDEVEVGDGTPNGERTGGNGENVGERGT